MGSSPATLHLKEEIERVAPSSSTVLITGESGTGKEMVATSIWREGSRKEGRFIALNCAAIPEILWNPSFLAMSKGPLRERIRMGAWGNLNLQMVGSSSLMKLAICLISAVQTAARPAGTADCAYRVKPTCRY